MMATTGLALDKSMILFTSTPYYHLGRSQHGAQLHPPPPALTRMYTPKPVEVRPTHRSNRHMGVCLANCLNPHS